MAEHVVELIDVALYGDMMQSIPNKIGEEIVRCRDCEDCNDEGIYTPQYYCVSRHWNRSWCGIPTDPNGFCKWGKKKEKKEPLSQEVQEILDEMIKSLQD